MGSHGSGGSEAGAQSHGARSREASGCTSASGRPSTSSSLRDFCTSTDDGSSSNVRDFRASTDDGSSSNVRDVRPSTDDVCSHDVCPNAHDDNGGSNDWLHLCTAAHDDNGGSNAHDDNGGSNDWFHLCTNDDHGGPRS